jgi:two-component system CheB/CheR fusion protein
MICVATNITDRHLLEQQLLEIAEREQARIGQELHDGLCQQLVGLAFDANSITHTLFEEVHKEAPLAKRIADDLDTAISQARQLSRGLFPIKVDADGLPSALEEYCRAISERFRLSCLFEPPTSIVAVDKRIATHLFRIAQEAVTNALKHSRARRIRVLLHADNEQVALEVVDDGIGIGTRPPPGTGIGLDIMEYRARSIGGTFAISDLETKGTCVSCCVPLKRR